MRIFLETANIFFFFFKKKKGNVHDFCLPTQLKWIIRGECFFIVSLGEKKRERSWHLAAISGWSIITGTLYRPVHWRAPGKGFSFDDPPPLVAAFVFLFAPWLAISTLYARMHVRIFNIGFRQVIMAVMMMDLVRALPAIILPLPGHRWIENLWSAPFSAGFSSTSLHSSRC